MADHRPPSPSTSPVEWAQHIHQKARALMMEVSAGLTELTPGIKDQRYPRGDQVDVGYFMRQIELILDETRKDFAARRGLIGQILAMMITREQMANPDRDVRARGRFASGVPDVKTRYRVPKPGCREYEELMVTLGLPTDAIKHGAIKLDFIGFSDLMMAREQVGKTGIPDGITTFPEYVTVFRKISGGTGRPGKETID